LFSFGLGGAERPKDGATQLATFDGLLTNDPTALNVSDPDGVRQISVAYTGKQATDVRMYVDPGTATGDLDEHTLVTVERDGDVIYDEVPLSAMPTGFAGAQASSWSIPADASGASRTADYDVTIKTDSASPDSGTVQDVRFIWEAQQA
jgi:hypothetical protein